LNLNPSNVSANKSMLTAAPGKRQVRRWLF
jgi:hypothetical protein